MDIEDAHKLKILPTADTRELLMAYFTPERRDEIQHNLSRLDVHDLNEQIVYLRSLMKMREQNGSSCLVKRFIWIILLIGCQQTAKCMTSSCVVLAVSS